MSNVKLTVNDKGLKCWYCRAKEMVAFYINLKNCLKHYIKYNMLLCESSRHNLLRTVIFGSDLTFAGTVSSGVQ